MIQRFLDFEIVKVLGRGAKGIVYLVEKSGVQFALKTIRKDDVDLLDASLRFRRESSAMSRLSHPGIVSVKEVGEAEGQPFMVMEYLKGLNVSDCLAKGPLEISAVLDLAKTMASALHSIHLLKMVHRDVKPENIIRTEDGHFKLIDFGLVAETGLRFEPLASSAVVGTLAYSSPEQCNINDEPVDQRSDLYSLGATLFEVTVGKPAFSTTDVAALLQEKVTLKIPNVHDLRPEASGILGEMICKLMAPSPEERYQTAHGFLQDLKNLKLLEELKFSGRPYQLDRSESNRQLAQIPMMGREKERSDVLESWKRLDQSGGTIAWISGNEGFGKTLLVQEVTSQITAAGGMILSTKCTRLDAIALSPILDLINLYFYQITNQGEEVKNRHLGRIKDWPSDIKKVVGQLSPEFASVAGLAKPKVSKEDETQEVLFQNIIQLFRKISTDHPGLTLTIEDLHWADENTTLFLRKLARELDSQSLYLILTCATNSEREEVIRDLAASLSSAITLRMELRALPSQTLKEMICAWLAVSEIEPNLADKLLTATHSNPQALKDYLNILLSSSILTIENGGAKIDFARLNEVDLSKDSYQRISDQIQRLEPEQRNFLSFAAIYGLRFPLDFILEISQSPQKSHSSLGQAGLTLGFIETSDKKNYLFTHEKIREAFLANLTEIETGEIRQKIVSHLEKVEDPPPETVFALAQQYLSPLSKKQTEKALHALLKAGELATKSSSHRQAYVYSAHANQLLEGAVLNEHLTVSCRMAYAIACLNTGRLEVAMDTLDLILSKRPAPFIKGQALYWKVRVATAQGELNEAWDHYLEATKTFGIPYPTRPLSNALSCLFYASKVFMQMKFKIGFGRYAGDSEARRRLEIVSDLEDRGAHIAYLRAKNFDALHTTLRFNASAFLLGPSRVLAHSLGGSAVIYSALKLEKASSANLNLASQIADELEDASVTTFLKYSHLLTLLFMGKFEEYDREYPQYLPLAEKYLHSIQLGLTLNAHAGILSQRGRALELVEFAFHKLGLVDETHEYTMMINFREAYAARLELVGRPEDAARLRQEGEQFVKMLGKQNIWNRMQTTQMRLASALEKMDVFSEEVEKNITEFLKNDLQSFFLVPGFITSAQIRLTQYEVSEDPIKKQKYLDLFKGTVARLKARAKTSISQCHYHIMFAALCRIQGDFKKAETHLRIGEKLSVDSDSQNGIYWAFLERARLEKSKGLEQRYRLEAKGALDYSIERKWKLRVERLQIEFPFLQKYVETQKISGAPAETETKVRKSSERGMSALLDISVAASRSIDPISQGRSTLDELVRLMSAERASIFLRDKNGSSLKHFLGRDSVGNDIQEMTGFSTTVIKKVFDEKKPMIITGTEQGEAIGSKSIVAHNLKSIMVVPLILMEELKGVIYLDSSITKGLFTEADLDLFAAIATQIAASIHISELATVESEKQVLQKDLELSASVQKMFLPNRTSADFGKVKLTGFYRPATVCSGDWWWYRTHAGKKITVAVGDVTGHGAGPAMITASVASSFTISERISGMDVGHIMEMAHKHLFEIAKSEYAMSMFACEIDPEMGLVRYWSAGAPFVFVFNPNKPTETLGAAGTLLGLENLDIGEGSYQAQSGDRIFIFSDGISEMLMAEGQQLGERRLKRLMEKWKDQDGESTKNSLIAELDRLRGSRPQDDDFTFVIIDIA